MNTLPSKTVAIPYTCGLAEELLNNILRNYDDWTLPEPPSKPTPKKRGIYLSPEDMQEAKKSMKENGIKAEDVKNVHPIEEIHGLDHHHCLRW